MKKMLSLVLALCMALAAVSALAEGDVTGTWYMKLLGLTVGSLELDAEGKCVLTAESSDGEVSREGTWALDGDILSLTIDESTLPMAWDGETLSVDLGALLSTTPEMSGIDLGGMDTSALNSLLEVTREPGKITAAAFSAYQADGTLPEGVTEAEMQAAQLEMMSAVMMLMGGMSTSSAADAPSPDAISVLEENFFIHDNYGGQGGTCLAKVKNIAETAVYLSGVNLTLKAEDGSEIVKAEYPNAVGSRYLEPGEETYISITADLGEGAAVAEHELSFELSSVSWQTPDVSLEVANPELRTDAYGYNTAAGMITNNGEKNLTSVSVIFAVRDAEGNLVDIASTGLYGAELPSGSSIILIGSISYNISEYCAANNIILTSVDAMAVCESSN